MMWGLLIFLIGLLYGWLTPGRQNKSALLVNGLWIGLVVALVLVLLGVAVGASALGLGTGFVAMLLTVVILTVVFVLGAWVGDLIESSMQRSRST